MNENEPEEIGVKEKADKERQEMEVRDSERISDYHFDMDDVDFNRSSETIPKKTNNRLSKYERRTTCKLRNTINALSGTYDAQISQKKWAQMVFEVVMMPSMIVLLMFAIPMCGPLDDMSCHRMFKKKFARWLCACVLCSVTAMIPLKTFENILIHPVFDKESFETWETLLVHVSAWTGVIITIEVYSAIVDPIPPFLFPLYFCTAWTFAAVAIGYIFYTSYWPLIKAEEDKSFLINGVIWVALINTFGCVVVFLYVGFSAGYRKINAGVEEDGWHPLAYYAYILIGLRIIREFSLDFSNYLWTFVDKSATMSTETWIFMIHAVTLSALRGGESSNPFKVIILTANDYFSIVLNILIIRFGKPTQWYKNCFCCKTYEEVKENLDIEVVIHRAQHLIQEELVEAIVPLIYLLTATIIYYLPNGKLVNGIRASEWGYFQLEDMGDFATMMIMVIFLEIFSFLILSFGIKYFTGLTLWYLVKDYLHEYGDIVVWNIVGAFTVLYVIQFQPFGADISFEFNWL